MNKDKSSLRNLNRSERQRRARWWFARMRHVIELTLPVAASPEPRPEQQTLLDLRQINLNTLTK